MISTNTRPHLPFGEDGRGLIHANMTLRETFEQAVAESKTITSRPDNNTLLKLYSLYKQATEGDAPSEGPSNPFDFIAKAKHTAWSEISGMDADSAMNQYIALVKQLKG